MVRCDDVFMSGVMGFATLVAAFYFGEVGEFCT